MAISNLYIWARRVFSDPKTRVEQVRPIFPTESERGWVNLSTVSVQQLNGMLKLLSQHSGCNPFAPQLILSSAVTPPTALEWVDGGTIVEENSPELFEHYGGTFPILQASAPAGWRYIVRNQ